MYLPLLFWMVQALFGLESRGGHQRLGVVQRQNIEQSIHHYRVRRTDKRLTAAGTLLKVHPNHSRFFFLLECRRNLCDSGFSQPRHGCCRSAKLQKIAAAVAFLLH
jgi:hypothetical protein